MLTFDSCAQETSVSLISSMTDAADSKKPAKEKSERPKKEPKAKKPADTPAADASPSNSADPKVRRARMLFPRRHVTIDLFSAV